MAGFADQEDLRPRFDVLTNQGLYPVYALEGDAFRRGERGVHREVVATGEQVGLQ